MSGLVKEVACKFSGKLDFLSGQRFVRDRTKPNWLPPEPKDRFTREETAVSARNGDKARFGRERQRKLLRRVRIRELRKELENKAGTRAKPTSDDGPKASEQPEDHHRDKEASSRTRPKKKTGVQFGAKVKLKSEIADK